MNIRNHRIIPLLFVEQISRAARDVLVPTAPAVVKVDFAGMDQHIAVLGVFQTANPMPNAASIQSRRTRSALSIRVVASLAFAARRKTFVPTVASQTVFSSLHPPALPRGRHSVKSSVTTSRGAIALLATTRSRRIYHSTSLLISTMLSLSYLRALMSS